MPSTPRFGYPIFPYTSIDSTMREASEWADRNAPEGSLIIADEQTAGRGRLGRSWISEPGVGLYFSIILRPEIPAAQAPVLTLAIGLGVARGIGEVCGRQCDLRWPNDVLLNEKKVSGILVEMESDQGRVRHVIAGVGINVNNSAMPPELTRIASSLKMETGCEFLLDVVRDHVLKQMERYYGMFLERGAKPIVDAFTLASSYVRGRRVVIENGDQRSYGVTVGLDPSGVLLLERPGGVVEPVLAGSVRPWADGEV